MKVRSFTAIGTTILVGLALSSAPALTKTATDCQKEWRADKAAARAGGKTQRAYVAECIGRASPQPATAPPADTSVKDGYGNKM